MCKDQVVHFIVLVPNSLSQVAQKLRVAGPDPYPIRYPSPAKLVGEGPLLILFPRSSYLHLLLSYPRFILLIDLDDA